MNSIENYLHSRDDVINRFTHIFNIVDDEMDSRDIFGSIVSVGSVTDIGVTDYSVVLKVEYSGCDGEIDSEEVTIPYHLFTSGTDSEILAYYTQLKKDISNAEMRINYCTVLYHINENREFVEYALNNMIKGKDYLFFNDRAELVEQYLKEKGNE